jgi:hypothetical protein
MLAPAITYVADKHVAVSCAMPPITDIRTKIDRAEKHIADLYQALILVAQGYQVGIKHDLSRNERVHYVGKLPEIPPDISLIAGDVLHNVRSALDHVAYQFVFKGAWDRTIRWHSRRVSRSS